jgi:hypothetical protein
VVYAGTIWWQATWQSRLAGLILAIAACFTSILALKVVRVLEKRHYAAHYGWDDVTKYSVTATLASYKAGAELLKRASAFARDENTIVYFYASTNPSNMDKHACSSSVS